jgi:hypothetical protein
MVLLFTLAAGFPATQGLTSAAMPPAHPAGCHAHGPTTPFPAPTSYQCCMSGHDAAIPNASFSLRPSSAHSTAAEFCPAPAGQRPRLDFAPRLYSALLVIPSDSPPVAAPLRI